MNDAGTHLDRIFSLREIEDALGRIVADAPRVSFNMNDVPEELHALAPYAIFWGIADDWARDDALRRTPDPLKLNLKRVVAKFDEPLDAWLAGPEASRADPTDAYTAFSAMRMAADFI